MWTTSPCLTQQMTLPWILPKRLYRQGNIHLATLLLSWFAIRLMSPSDTVRKVSCVIAHSMALDYMHCIQRMYMTWHMLSNLARMRSTYIMFIFLSSSLLILSFITVINVVIIILVNIADCWHTGCSSLTEECQSGNQSRPWNRSAEWHEGRGKVLCWGKTLLVHLSHIAHFSTNELHDNSFHC